LNFFLKETKSALIIVGIDLGGDKRKKKKKGEFKDGYTKLRNIKNIESIRTYGL
jgi:hypothetical protein